MVSVSRTPASVVVRRSDADGEYRAGTYAFHDRATVAAGAACLEDVALTVCATVVSRPTRDRAILDAWLEVALLGPLPGRRLRARARGTGVDALPARRGARLPRARERRRRPPRPAGPIVPNHACAVSNLFAEFVLTRDGGSPGAGPWTREADNRRGRAVLFDFNGTLSHDEPVWFEIYTASSTPSAAARSARGVLRAARRPVRRRGRADVARRERPGLIEQGIDHYLAAAGDGSTVPESSREAVAAAAARVPVGIVTTAKRHVLDRSSPPPALVPASRSPSPRRTSRERSPTRRATWSRSPAPGVEPADVLVLEDTPLGVAAAKAAGVRCCRGARLGDRGAAGRSRRDRRPPRRGDDPPARGLTVLLLSRRVVAVLAVGVAFRRRSRVSSAASESPEGRSSCSPRSSASVRRLSPATYSATSPPSRRSGSPPSPARRTPLPASSELRRVDRDVEQLPGAGRRERGRLGARRSLRRSARHRGPEARRRQAALRGGRPGARRRSRSALRSRNVAGQAGDELRIASRSCPACRARVWHVGELNRRRDDRTTSRSRAGSTTSWQKLFQRRLGSTPSSSTTSRSVPGTRVVEGVLQALDPARQALVDETCGGSPGSRRAGSMSAKRCVPDPREVSGRKRGALAAVVPSPEKPLRARALQCGSGDHPPARSSTSVCAGCARARSRAPPCRPRRGRARRGSGPATTGAGSATAARRRPSGGE